MIYPALYCRVLSDAYGSVSSLPSSMLECEPLLENLEVSIGRTFSHVIQIDLAVNVEPDNRSREERIFKKNEV